MTRSAAGEGARAEEPGGPPAPFNLVDEPWIMAVPVGGVAATYSLREVFRQAGHIRQLTGELPTQSFALLRLLLAIVYRAVEGPVGVDDWVALRDHWPDVVADIDAYLTRHRDRFELFDEVAPFYQVAGLRTAKGEALPVRKIVADVPDGVQYLTLRTGSGIESLSVDEAARWLVHVHGFDPSGIKSGLVGDPRVKGGKVYPLGTAWAGQLGGVHLFGATLRDTILLNLVARDVDDDAGWADLPPWERPPLTAGEEVAGGRPPRGVVDAYTWQSRRVRLVGAGRRVTGVVLGYGDPLSPQNRASVEPMTAWRYSEPQSKKAGRPVQMPRAHQLGAQPWRGLEALLALGGTAEARQGRAPGVVEWASELTDAGALVGGHAVRTRAIGMVYGSNSSVIEDIVDDSLTLPADLLRNDAAQLRLTAVGQVERARDAVTALAGLARNLAAAAGADATDGDADRARELGYAVLDGPFRSWLIGLRPDELHADAAARWQRLARESLEPLARELIAAAPPSAWVGRQVRGRLLDVGVAEEWFRKALGQALPRAWPEPGGGNSDGTDRPLASGEREQREAML